MAVISGDGAPPSRPFSPQTTSQPTHVLQLDLTPLLRPSAAVERRTELVAAVRAQLEALLAGNQPTLVLQRAALHPLIQAVAHVPPALPAGAAAPDHVFRAAPRAADRLIVLGAAAQAAA